MTEPTLLIYGANGFTGALIAERARERGLRPVVAGRSREAVEAIGARLGLTARVFDLEVPDAVVEGIRGARLVLHCAGPYSKTSRPMVDACLRAGAHYLDITGEAAVLEAVLARDAEARGSNAHVEYVDLGTLQGVPQGGRTTIPTAIVFESARMPRAR